MLPAKSFGPADPGLLGLPVLLKPLVQILPGLGEKRMILRPTIIGKGPRMRLPLAVPIKKRDLRIDAPVQINPMGEVLRGGQDQLG